MKNENKIPANIGDLNGRITRARAAALSQFRKMPPSKASTQQDQMRILRANSKRAAIDENNTGGPANAGSKCKRRAVLRDVTNVCCENSYKSCFSATKIRIKNRKQVKKGQPNVSKVAPSVSVKLPHLQTNSKKIVGEAVRKEPKPEVMFSSASDIEVPSELGNSRELGMEYHHLPNQDSGVPSQSYSPSNREKCDRSENGKISDDPDFKDIDCDYKDPQLCSVYAAEIYANLRAAEVVRRPRATFMETIQQEITQTMRGVLVDWLIEVSEEYKLVPDTLYLTVYLIDLFLSQNYVERHRLQLLGITCMLIASKFEEICVPRVEEFCFITDNTYTREEVLKMESQVLKCFGFQIFAPTTKTFLRRFLRVAQACYKSPSYELEYLADYLAELTLVEYSFLNFLPSLIAASAVFLARWTLDQTIHPWNSTLQHYTSYKASDLKTTILALQDLQLRTNGGPLNAIRMKYRQHKFKSVAALSSPKLLETPF